MDGKFPLLTTNSWSLDTAGMLQCPCSYWDRQKECACVGYYTLLRMTRKTMPYKVIELSHSDLISSHFCQTWSETKPKMQREKQLVCRKSSGWPTQKRIQKVENRSTEVIMGRNLKTYTDVHLGSLLWKRKSYTVHKWEKSYVDFCRALQFRAGIATISYTNPSEMFFMTQIVFMFVNHLFGQIIKLLELQFY